MSTSAPSPSPPPPSGSVSPPGTSLFHEFTSCPPSSYSPTPLNSPRTDLIDKERELICMHVCREAKGKSHEDFQKGLKIYLESFTCPYCSLTFFAGSSTSHVKEKHREEYIRAVTRRECKDQTERLQQQLKATLKLLEEKSLLLTLEKDKFDQTKTEFNKIKELNTQNDAKVKSLSSQWVLLTSELAAAREQIARLKIPSTSSPAAAVLETPKAAPIVAPVSPTMLAPTVLVTNFALPVSMSSSSLNDNSVAQLESKIDSRDIVNLMNQILPPASSNGPRIGPEYQADLPPLGDRTVINGARSFSMREDSDSSSEDTAPKRRRQNSSSSDDVVEVDSEEDNDILECKVPEFTPITVQKRPLFRWKNAPENSELRWKEHRLLLLDWLSKHPHCHDKDILASELLAEMGFTSASHHPTFITNDDERIPRPSFLRSITGGFTHRANIDWSQRLEYPGFVFWQQQVKGGRFQWVIRYNKRKTTN